MHAWAMMHLEIVSGNLLHLDRATNLETLEISCTHETRTQCPGVAPPQRQRSTRTPPPKPDTSYCATRVSQEFAHLTTNLRPPLQQHIHTTHHRCIRKPSAGPRRMSARPPGAQRVPRQRLNSIRNIRRGSVASNASGTGNNNNSNSGGQQQARRPAARRICANCKSENIIEDDGQLVCANCASVYDSSNIVSDITFGETSTGQAVVQGSHIGENQRFAQTLGAHAPRGAQGPGSSRDHALKAGQSSCFRR